MSREKLCNVLQKAKLIPYEQKKFISIVPSHEIHKESILILHQCKENIDGYDIELLSDEWTLYSGDIYVSILFCPFCGEKLENKEKQ